MNLRRLTFSRWLPRLGWLPLAALVTLLALSAAWSGRARAAGGNEAPASSASSAASAQPPPLPHRPIVALATPEGARGPLVLAARDGAYVGEVTLRNDGGEPLLV